MNPGPELSDDGPARAGRLGLALGGASFLAVLLTLGNPGITIDEPLDVRVGHRYVEALGRALEGRWSPFRRDHVDRLFADNAQHPPLGRLLVGLASVGAEPFENILGGADPFGVHPARLAPAAAFGCLVAMVVLWTSRRHGRIGGIVAGLSILAMPRVFAHAHFATLDTILTLFWVGAVLAVAGLGTSRWPYLASFGAGLVWGLALLTKIHAWLLPPVIVPWLLLRLGWRRGAIAAVAWLGTGLLVLAVGWPWLWYDPVGRLVAFLGTSVERLSLRVQYLGSVYEDREVPWHYPWVYFATTVPVGLHLLGLAGVLAAWRARRDQPAAGLLAAAMVLLLVVFSTRAPVYDGERLFLPVFPLWAVFVGRGFAAVWARLRRPAARVALGLLLAAQGFGLVAYHPFGLSYYNLLIGGLPGAERLGMELTYWGDAIDPRLLDDLAQRVEPGQTVALAPTLHHAQAAATTTPALHARGITLQDESAVPQADWILVYRRTAYWTPELQALTREQAASLRTRNGVWLSGLWRRPAP